MCPIFPIPCCIIFAKLDARVLLDSVNFLFEVISCEMTSFSDKAASARFSTAEATFVVLMRHYWLVGRLLGLHSNMVPLVTCYTLQYTMYLSTARGSSLAVNDRTMDVRVTSDRPSTP